MSGDAEPLVVRCPVCGRGVVVHDGRLREHLPPGRFETAKCPGSGAKVEASS